MGFRCVGLAEVKALEKAGDAIFVDARDPEEFHNGHLPAAISLPATSFRKGRPEMLDYLPDTESYVVYCADSQHCARAELVARQLIIYGFTNVAVFRGGFKAWEKAGLAVQSKRDRRNE